MGNSDAATGLRAGTPRSEPMVWVSAGAVGAALLILLGLLLLLASRGFPHFWPRPLEQVRSISEGPAVQLGHILDRESSADGDRVLMHRGAEDHFDSPLVWIEERTVLSRARPPDALVLERSSQGPVFGFLGALDSSDGTLPAGDMAAAEQVRFLRDARDRVLGAEEGASDLSLAAALRLVDGRVVRVPLVDMVDAHAPNGMGTAERVGHLLGALGRFVSQSPRRSNIQGGVFPAIVGTVTLVFLMVIIVAPLGVLAAVYLQEYAQRGPVTRLVRIAVNNLAGVPSIVYGVFGLGFFVYGVGGSLDTLFFYEDLPAPTLGTPGMLWAALTMALLTLPVVIVATEEGLARVPKSLREGSLALGATRAESLLRVVLPAATPAVLTGLILAVARATGEVAPLLLVGVAKYAPGLPVSTEAPYLHLDRQFMHLGFYIYDLGFQSPYLETAEGLVFATALLLVLIVLLLNVAAVMLRNRLRDRFHIQDIR